MKSDSWKHAAASVLMLAILVHASAVSAHLLTGSLLKPASARDVHQVSCPDAGARLEVQVRDNAPVQPPVINVLVEKDANNVAAFDKKDGDRPASPLVVLEGGAGDYNVTVFKTAKTEPKRARKEIYTLIYHCMVGPRHTTTNWTYLINE